MNKATTNKNEKTDKNIYIEKYNSSKKSYLIDKIIIYIQNLYKYNIDINNIILNWIYKGRHFFYKNTTNEDIIIYNYGHNRIYSFNNKFKGDTLLNNDCVILKKNDKIFFPMCKDNSIFNLFVIINTKPIIKPFTKPFSLFHHGNPYFY